VSVAQIEPDLLVFSLPLETLGLKRQNVLGAAEMAVVELAARGHSNATIASLRGCSINTVANQLAAAYRKLGVHGRRELAARLASWHNGP
jgi:DNA-binding CsgD family transcriptional regulator